MSSGSTEQSPQDEPASEKRASGASENDAEGLARATECPSCGTTFASDYCPSCGQAADPSVSATAVIGGFFRELVDVENGFWPTLIRLTFHPGKTLRRYLDGARGSLVSPGRYLLASVIISFSASWILLRTGPSRCLLRHPPRTPRRCRHGHLGSLQRSPSSLCNPSGFKSGSPWLPWGSLL
ncbi:DUF3667 domain-containing protein [Salinibacter ruber]|uniref:DUF3667 domain-containing protein n=1 Tax=Salinibacter ruber TaxID=146919 RepID=UPI0011D2C428